jgi:hypothetical protein
VGDYSDDDSPLLLCPETGEVWAKYLDDNEERYKSFVSDNETNKSTKLILIRFIT